MVSSHEKSGRQAGRQGRVLLLGKKGPKTVVRARMQRTADSIRWHDIASWPAVVWWLVGRSIAHEPRSWLAEGGCWPSCRRQSKWAASHQMS
jgi:hypothetical protein